MSRHQDMLPPYDTLQHKDNKNACRCCTTKMLHPHHKVLSGVGGGEGGMSQPLKDTQEATIKQTGTAMVNNE